MNWSSCYLSNMKQFIGYNVGSKSNLLDIVCGVPQGFIFGPLLFLIYINDLPLVSKLLDSIMFADDTNLFFSGKDIHSFFNTAVVKHHWFNSNNLSLNADKNKFTLFHNVSKRDNIPVVLPTMKINNILFKASRPYQVFRSLVWWKSYKSYWGQISKSLVILHWVNFLLNQKSSKNVYFYFIHSYINFGNISLGSTYKTKLKKIFTYQKKAARVIFFADRLAYAKPLILDMNALNIYQINTYQHLILLYEAQTDTAPLIYFNKFSKVSHNFPTSSKNSCNYTIPKLTMKLTNFATSQRGLILWNKVLDPTLKEISKLIGNKNTVTDICRT